MAWHWVESVASSPSIDRHSSNILSTALGSVTESAVQFATNNHVYLQNMEANGVQFLPPLEHKCSIMPASGDAFCVMHSMLLSQGMEDSQDAVKECRRQAEMQLFDFLTTQSQPGDYMQQDVLNQASVTFIAFPSSTSQQTNQSLFSSGLACSMRFETASSYNCW